MITGWGGNRLRGNPRRLGMLLHWTYLLSLWGDFKSVKKGQQLTDGDPLLVTRCKEGRSLQAVETWRVARPHCPAGRGQSQPELFENGWLTVELSHCGAAMSWFRVEGEKQNQPQPSKCCASLRKPLSHCSRCRRYLCADVSQMDFVLHRVQDHLNSSPKWIINHPPLELAWYSETVDSERWRLCPHTGWLTHRGHQEATCAPTYRLFISWQHVLPSTACSQQSRRLFHCGGQQSSTEITEDYLGSRWPSQRLTDSDSVVAR